MPAIEGKIAVWGGKEIAKRVAKHLQERAAQVHKDRLEDDFQQLLIEIEALNPNAEEVEARLASVDLGVDDILRDFFLMMLGSRGGKAKAAIAKLTAHYFSNRKSSDRFFRRFGRLLEQCEDPVLVCIAALVGYLLKRNDGTDVAVYLRAEESGEKFISLMRHKQTGQTEPYAWDTDYYEAFWLMKQFGFGKELHSGIGTVAGPLSMHIRVEAWPEFEMLYKFLQ